MSKLVRFVVTVGCSIVLLSSWAMSDAHLPDGSSGQAHYERPSTKGGPYKNRVIVFVHGIFGDADSTWRYSTSVYWPNLLLTDEAFRDSDVYVASYSSPYFGNTMNLTEVVNSLNSRLVSDEIFSKHREVVFVCHSLGGLVVQELLLTFRDYSNKVPFIYFFSTPESGAQIANIARIFSSDPLLRVLIQGDENDYLQNLENQWKAAHFPIRRYCAYEKKKTYKGGVGVLVVDRLSGTRNCDEPAIPIKADHFDIVKPDGKEHPSYIAFRNVFSQYLIGPSETTMVPATKQPRSKTHAVPSVATQSEGVPNVTINTGERAGGSAVAIGPGATAVGAKGGDLNLTVSVPLSVLPSSISFSEQEIGTISEPKSFKIINNNAEAIEMPQLETKGPFSTATDCKIVVKGSPCIVNVRFQPIVIGGSSGSIRVLYSSALGESEVELSGTGIPKRDSVGSNRVIIAAPAIWISKDGTISANGLNGACVPGLASGGTPGGLVEIVTDYITGPGTDNITASGGLGIDCGNGLKSGNGGSGSVVIATPLKTYPTSIVFPQQPVGTTSDPKSFDIINNGTIEQTVLPIDISGPFAIKDTNCAQTLKGRSRCSVKVAFTPQVAQRYYGTIQLPQAGVLPTGEVYLEGTGTPKEQRDQ